MDRKVMLASLAALSLSLEALGLKEDAKEQDIFEALGKRTPPPDEKATKKAVDEALSAVNAELAGRKLKIEAGKVVELAAVPPAAETDETKALKAKLAAHEAEFSRQRAAKAKDAVALAVKEGKLPPALAAKAEQLLAMAPGKVKALQLSTDGKSVTDSEIEPAALVTEILAALPAWGGKGLSQQLSAEGKKKAEELAQRGAKAMRKAQGTAEPKKGEEA